MSPLSWIFGALLTVYSGSIVQDWAYVEIFGQDGLHYIAQKKNVEGSKFVFQCYRKELSVFLKGNSAVVGKPKIRLRVGNQVLETVSKDSGAATLEMKDVAWLMRTMFDNNERYDLRFSIGNPITFEFELRNSMWAIRKVIRACSTVT